MFAMWWVPGLILSECIIGYFVLFFEDGEQVDTDAVLVRGIILAAYSQKTHQ
jgi:hypothetical protein